MECLKCRKPLVRVNIIFLLISGNIFIAYNLCSIYVKTFSMIRTQAMLIYCLPVKSCSISFILFPSIVWILMMQLLHIFITISFCQNAGGSDRSKFSITLNDTSVRQIFICIKPISIYQS
jgi:hypothetical protein